MNTLKFKTMKTRNTMKTIKLMAVLFISALTFTACNDNDDDHGDDHDEEVITTLTYTLTDGVNTITLEFDDPDGEGSAQPTYNISGPLAANTTYTGTLKLENKTESPAEDVTLEIIAEDDEHEFFFTNTAGLTITKTDVDGNNNPLGVQTTLMTGAAGQGTLTIVLKHEPTKPNDGTAAGAGGSTDIEVTFNVTVQ